MKNLSLLLVVFLINTLASAQNIKGTVVDENKQPLPFVNIFWKGTTNGTSTNLNGEFSLKPSSSDSVVVKMVGYQKKVVSKQKASGTIQLLPDVVKLKTVEIKARKKDPAYDIIKKAIRKRKFHLNQVEALSGDIYMKSRMEIIAIPEFIKKQMEKDSVSTDLNFKTGVFSVSESVSKFAKAQPNKYKEEMIASKVSGTPFGEISEYSWNRANQVLVSFYEPIIPFSERGIISPISPTALAYYDYKLLGFYVENGNIINKIKVIPKRAADQVFEGEIYIVEEDWAIHSLNLKVRKTANLPNIDSLLVTQNYTEIEPEVWIPLSLNEDFYFNIMGIKLRYIAQGNINNYNIHPNFPEGYFSNEVFKVEKEVKENTDTTYWGKNRPGVLMKEELETYEKGDSVIAVMSSPAYLDSVDRRGNKFKTMDLLTGYTYLKTRDSLSISVPGLLSILNFNTVDGWRPYIEPTFRKTKNSHDNVFKAGLGYAEARNKLMGNFEYTSRRNYINFLQYSVFGGYQSLNVNTHTAYPDYINTYFTYFRERNLAKFYNQLYFGGLVSREITTGLNGAIGVKWSERYALSNNSTAVFKNFENRSYTPNFPNAISTTTSTVLKGKLSFRPFQKFASYPDRKAYTYNKWPTLSLEAIYASPALGDAEYLKLKYALKGKIDLKQLGSSSWGVQYTQFANKKQLSFIDFEHFNGNQTAIYQNSLFNYHYLPFYTFSTNNNFAQASIEHHFNGFIWNKIPLLKKLPWRTLAGVKHIELANQIRYTEFYFGIERILQVLRIDAGFSLINDKAGPFKVQLVGIF